MAVDTYMHRGQYRFRYPLEYRYELFSWPSEICAKCNGCGSELPFNAAVPDTHVKDDESGGYRLVERPMSGPIAGKGTCLKCGHVSLMLSWPNDAHFQFPLPGGDIWAWNEEHVRVLRAKVSGDRVLERKLCERNRHLHYYLSRLPKQVVVKRNRMRLLRAIDKALRHEPPGRSGAKSFYGKLLGTGA